MSSRAHPEIEARSAHYSRATAFALPLASAAHWSCPYRAARSPAESRDRDGPIPSKAALYCSTDSPAATMPARYSLSREEKVEVKGHSDFHPALLPTPLPCPAPLLWSPAL